MAQTPIWKADGHDKQLKPYEVSKSSAFDGFAEFAREKHSKAPKVEDLQKFFASCKFSEESFHKVLDIARFFVEKWFMLNTRLIGQEHLVENYRKTLDELKKSKERAYRWETEARDLRQKLGQIAQAPSRPYDVFNDRAVKRVLNSLLADNKSLVSMVNQKMGSSSGAEMLRELETAKSRVKDLEKVLTAYEQERLDLTRSLERLAPSKEELLQAVVEQQFDRIRNLTIQVHKQQQLMSDFDSLASILKSEVSKVVGTLRNEFVFGFEAAKSDPVQCDLPSRGFVEAPTSSSVSHLFSWTEGDHRVVPPLESKQASSLPVNIAGTSVASMPSLRADTMLASFDAMRVSNRGEAFDIHQSKKRSQNNEMSPASDSRSYTSGDLPNHWTGPISEQLCSRCPQLERQLVELKSRLIQQENSSKENMSVLQQMQKSIDEASRKLNEKEAENLSLKQDLSQKCFLLDDYTKKNSQLVNEVASWTTAAKDFQAEGNVIQRAAREQEKELRALRTEVAGLQAQLADLVSKCVCKQRHGRDPDTPLLPQARKSPTETAFTKSQLHSRSSFSTTTARPRISPSTTVPEPYQVMGPKWQGMNVFQGSVSVRDGPWNANMTDPAHSDKQSDFGRFKPDPVVEPCWGDRPEQKLKCEYCEVMFPSSLIMDHLRECMKINGQ